MKERLEFIDCAKGICILLVVAIHLDWYNLIYFTPRISNAFFAFRMPLYFILSGLFLSFGKNSGKSSVNCISDQIYGGGYQSFLDKKINRLIIPFIFFSLLANAYNLFLYKFGFHSDFVYRSIAHLWYYEGYAGTGSWNNGPIDFVIWLFNAYMIVAFLNFITNGNMLWMVPLSLIIGIIGYYIILPMSIDTAMTCTPFVICGMVIKRYTKFLSIEGKTTWKRYVAISIAILALLILRNPQPQLFYCNEYGTNVVEVYLWGILGSLSVLLFAKACNRIPYVNFLGRYSIIVLGTHNIFIEDAYSVFHILGIGGKKAEVLVFISIILISSLFIIIFKRFIPKLVAQDDLMHFNWSK